MSRVPNTLITYAAVAVNESSATENEEGNNNQKRGSSTGSVKRGIANLDALPSDTHHQMHWSV